MGIETRGRTSKTRRRPDVDVASVFVVACVEAATGTCTFRASGSTGVVALLEGAGDDGRDVRSD